MIGEISDALFCLFAKAEEEEIIADCWLYLKEHGDNTLKQEAEKQLLKMDRCPKCGEHLVRSVHKEKHDELEAPSYEYFEETYCPICTFLR